jgi:hypothetical protein|tara:strand:- start:34 stop:234 length:201 start_codon:yes stop_codon:yes gene_type:complete
MTENKKTIIVFGESENEKLMLINKLLNDGLRVKSCTGNVYNDIALYWGDEKLVIKWNIHDESRLGV